MGAWPTFGAVFLGILFIGIEVRVQRIGLKALQSSPLGVAQDLFPFVRSWCIGALFVMVGAGIIGFFGDFALWGLGAVGDWMLIAGVGAKGGTAPGSASQPLAQGGLFAAFLLICWMWPRGRSQWLGFLSGIGMGTSAGVAHFAAVPLASGVNIAGMWLTGIVNGMG